MLVRGIEEGGKARGDESRPLGVDMVENQNAQARAESLFTRYYPRKLYPFGLWRRRLGFRSAMPLDSERASQHATKAFIRLRLRRWEKCVPPPAT